MSFIDDSATLEERLVSLELEISTVDAEDAGSSSSLFANVVFADGTRLYEPFNHLVATTLPLNVDAGPLPLPGHKARFALPVPKGLRRTLGSIDELLLRKDGDDGWFVGSVLLFANGHHLPLLGNRHANQFLDNDDSVLRLRDWSTRSFCVAPATEAGHPLLRSGYRVLGPVLGQISDTSAVVLYRVDREGTYRFRAVDRVTGVVVGDITKALEPTGRFELTGLTPGRTYEFDLAFVRAGVETPVPDARGSLRTYPVEGSLGRFAFAFGSCAKPSEQAAQGSWTAIRSLAQPSSRDIEPVRLFVHLGDSFYFYDDMTNETARNVETMHAAHVSMRRHLEFLDMARVVPCCGIWDDHDFAGNNTYSTSISPALLSQGIDTWLQFWGNNQPLRDVVDKKPLGLSTRISHGLVDIYLLDGRFARNPDKGVYFGQKQINALLESIRVRAKGSPPRVVVLASGSNWNHNGSGAENYGSSKYEGEREGLFSALAARMGGQISGLLLISGDNHLNEIFHVKLLRDGSRIAPELVSSPLTLNDDEDAQELTGERVASFSAARDGGKRGFAVLTIDTSSSIPDGNWTATVRYHQEMAAVAYESRTYTLHGGQFLPNPI